jgi:ATP-dependent protease ClpP protease subunit
VKSAEILIYDVIGEDWFGGGVTAKGFAEQLAALDLRAGDELTLRVNSPGGSVYDGWAIYNTLLQHPATKIARVDGLAASAASYIIQAANRVEVAEASMLMIHNAWAITIGDANDHLKGATELEKLDGLIAGIYAKRSKKPAAEFVAAMNAETWYTGKEAIDAGLADSLIETPEAAPAARHDGRILAFYRKAPAAARNHFRLSPSGVRLAPAAMAQPRSEGKVLSAANKSRLNQIRDLAQEVIDSAEPAPAEDSTPATPACHATDVRAEMVRATMRAEIETAEAATAA